MPVSLVKRAAISFCFLYMAGVKLFQQRYEIARDWARAGGTCEARMPARPATVAVATKWRRVMSDMEMTSLSDVSARKVRRTGPGAGVPCLDRGTVPSPQ